jgi:hypothetical protein
VVRSERLIKLRDSWFSAKSILVERLNFSFFGVELSINYGDESLTDFNETSNTKKGYQADKL